jgi:HD superfamily phosphodiesterase
MKLTFGDDKKRISHALLVLEAAQDILRHESAEPRVVLPAAVLHDIGIQAAERKHGSNAGVYQEMEGPAIAEPIMLEVNLDRESIDHVLKIIANHHSARDIDTIEFRILWDADWLINLRDEYPDLQGEGLVKKIEKIFKTATGKKMAYERFVNQH